MKALTLHQPWSWAIAHADKRVENRTWAPPASVIGQRVAIHAGKKLDLDAEVRARMGGMGLLAEDVPDAFVHGAVESVATIAGWVDQSGHITAASFAALHDASGLTESPWWVGPIGWVLADVIALPEPVPCRGAQGLWTLPADIEGAVLAQIGRAA